MFTLGTAVVIFLLLFRGVRYRGNYLTYLLKVLIFFSVYLNVGYMMKIGSYELEYSEALMIIFSIVGLFHVKLKLPKSSLLLVSFFSLIVFVGYLFLLNNPQPPMALPIGGSWDLVAFGTSFLEPAAMDSSFIKRILRIVLYILVYCIFDAYVLKNNERTTEIKKYVVKAAVFVSVLGIIEQLSILMLHNDIIVKAADTIFGVGGSQLTWLTQRGGLPVLQGLMLEPGHYAQSFIPAIFILFRDKLFTEKQRFRLFILFAYVIFCSGSFAGFGIVLFMTLLYVFSKKSKVFVKLFSLVSVIIVLSIVIGLKSPDMLAYYTSRISGLFGQSQLGFSTSDSVRSLSRSSAYDLFRTSPLIGVGFGVTDVLGFIPTMLANFGIIGTVLWFVTMLNGFTSSKTQNLKWLIMFIPLFFFIGSFSYINSMDMMLLFALVFRKYQPQINKKEKSIPDVKFNENHVIAH